MTAVLAWARLDLRRRWRSLVVLALLVGVAGGVVLLTAAGARRTATATPRFVAVAPPADVMVLPNDPTFDWDPIRKLPSVKDVGTFVLTDGASFDAGPVPVEQAFGFAPGDENLNITVDRPLIQSGRLFNTDDPTEALASKRFVQQYGRTITIHLPTREQVAGASGIEDTPEGFVPTGKTVTLHVVGIAENTFTLGPFEPAVQPSYGFFRDYMKPVYDYFANARITLKDGAAGIPAFRRELAAATGNPNIDVVDVREGLASTQRAADFTATGWWLFSGAALLASVILVGQAMVRFCAGTVDELRTLAALGMEARQVRVAAVAGPVVASVAGGVIAAVGAGLLSGLFPTGIAKIVEPFLGMRWNLLIVLGGAALLVAIGIGGGFLAAFLATRSGDGSTRPSVVATAATRAGLGPVAVLGVRLALEPGRGRSRVPVRPALIGIVAGVLGIVGALTFRAGLDNAISDPARFGQTLPYGAFVAFNGGPDPATAQAIQQAAKDPAVAVMDDMRVAVFPVNERQVSTFSLTPLTGTVDVVATKGRAPQTVDEISLGPDTAKGLHVGVGDVVHVGPASSPRPMTVSGITFVPEDAHNGYADGAWLTTQGFAALQPESKDKYHEVRFAFRKGTDVDAATTRLGKLLGEVGPLDGPQEQHYLSSVRWQPLLLGGFLLILALGAVGHALASAVRRRRHDMAVLRALGMTRRQSRLTVATQATVLALVGIVFGIPLGLAAGRTGWRALANATPVLYAPPLALLVLLLAVPVTIVVANVLAALPARRAARLEVGQILRAE